MRVYVCVCISMASKSVLVSIVFLMRCKAKLCIVGENTFLYDSQLKAKIAVFFECLFAAPLSNIDEKYIV